VKKFKNPKLPIIPEDERAEVLSALSLIDYIVIFDDPTADGLLMRLKPDVHAKGTDYTLDTVPERSTVSSYGGEIVIVGDKKSHATSKIIQKIRRFKSL
jgi:rfaE bifunctional protein nucleotidyltransferase chain/domain